MAETQLYSCFDFRLRSDIRLAELAPAGGTDDRTTVDVRVARVPETLPDAPPPQSGLQVRGETVLLSVPGVARYLVQNGHEMLVDPAPGAAERNVRLFLLGSALGILSHQRGLLPLHANAIVADGGAYAFGGHSGAGKSTLAAHFARAGYEILCDDVCAVSFADGVPSVWPGPPRLKLWGDAAQAFGHDRASLNQAIDGLDKYHVPLADTRAAARPVPSRRLYLLAKAGPGEPRAISQLRGQRAITAVMQHTYRNSYLGPMGLTAQHFRLCAELMRHAKIYEAHRDWGFDVFDREAEAIERHIRRPD